MSLPLRISLGLVLATILPLVITLFVIEWRTQPILTDQANKAMQGDAKTRVDQINTYFNERVLDAQTITQVPTVPQYLITPPTDPTYADQTKHTIFALAAGMYRDKNYTTWQLYDRHGKLRLAYPTTQKPVLHGKTLVPQLYQDEVFAGQTVISTVYYNPDAQKEKATVDIYSPVAVITPEGKTTNTLIGFIRVTLGLDYIWDIVKGDTQNGKNSYAFILNEDGVRIADTDPKRIFTAVENLPPDVQQQVSNEQRYGPNPIPVKKDVTLTQHLKDTASSVSYQAQLTEQNESYQIVQANVKQKAQDVPWKYYVLSPLSTVNAVAQQQLEITLLVALIMSGLVAIIGLVAGRSLTRPILQAVNALRDSSDALNSLASRQRDASTEQMWVVESSQIGLQSVQYYTEAINSAATQLAAVGKNLGQNMNQLDRQKLLQAIEHVQNGAKYIENAAQYQNESNKKLATALKVTNQVTEQLASGATSATDAAAQLEDVVSQLREVVG
ncbi:methyl-accepting chemotaxis protein [Ktedonobacter racemifer]|nr:methyl-accepting chemotaxis protein [Ktedonobacter racemifer]